MKKILCLLLVVICAAMPIALFTFNVQNASADQTIIPYGIIYDGPTYYVQTPNGSNIVVYINGDISDVEKYALNDYIEENYIIKYSWNAILLADATPVYNCHSYAWYMQSTDNPYCMQDPSPYYTDGSYEEVSFPHAGDKICYFNDSGSNLHSGVIKSVSTGVSNNACGNADLMTVVSKWGDAGLYEHRGDECIYASPYGDAVEVRYYHRHNFEYTNNNNGTHTAYCNCGDSEIVPHAYEYTINTDNTHTASCICGASETKAHSFNNYTVKNSDYHTVSCECGLSKQERHAWTPYIPTLSIKKDLENIRQTEEPCVTGDSYVKCLYCSLIKKLNPGDFVPIIKG